MHVRQVLALAGEEAAERAFLLAQHDGPASAAARKLRAIQKSTSDDDLRKSSSDEMDVDGPASGAGALIGAIEAWLAAGGDKSNGASSANGSNSNISDANGSNDNLRSAMRSFWPAAVSRILSNFFCNTLEPRVE